MNKIKQIVMDVLERVHPNEYEILKNNKRASHISRLESYQRLPKKNGSFNAMIHYPNITIENSEGHKHKMENLFILLTFSNGKMRSEIYGFRTTMDFKEYTTGYSHSHLSSNSTLGNIGAFCLGSSAVAQQINTISLLSQRNELTEEAFESFIHSLDQYVRWESIEGVPYKYMLELEYERQDVVMPSGNITLSQKFKDELFKCVEFVTTGKERYSKISITPSEALIEHAPNEYNRHLFNNIPFTKRMFSGEMPDEVGSFQTRNFNMPLEITNSEKLEGIDHFGKTISKQFISSLEEKLTNNFNNIALWKK